MGIKLSDAAKLLRDYEEVYSHALHIWEDINDLKSVIEEYDQGDYWKEKVEPEITKAEQNYWAIRLAYQAVCRTKEDLDISMDSLKAQEQNIINSLSLDESEITNTLGAEFTRAFNQYKVNAFAQNSHSLMGNLEFLVSVGVNKLSSKLQHSGLSTDSAKLASSKIGNLLAREQYIVLFEQWKEIHGQEFMDRFAGNGIKHLNDRIAKLKDALNELEDVVHDLTSDQK